ncbi:protein CHUP1, chloroplastic-like [Vigna umbellata]|uniref:protein CHUP1, chloroplastic-like n=1 Tax=Vigna umbellata TaxID=87088 RepID=UPI001F5FD1EE|nr:protein CHUP1, chloroplastic-like [Vigna umbellata]
MGLTPLKPDNFKPLILKAGVPLAASLAGFIYAWILAKKNLSSKVFSSPENGCHSPKITSHQRAKHESFDSLSYVEDGESSTPMNRLVMIHDKKSCSEHEITGLRNQIEGLQMRELAMRLQFELYCEMKAQESLLVEVRNMLSLENDRAEFLSKEISSIETETMKLESFVVHYMSVVEQLQYWRSQNRVLQRRVQKLLRDSKGKSRLIKVQALMIKEKEEELLRNHEDFQTRVCVINKLEGEIRELRRILEQMEEEKKEVVKKLERAEAEADASKLNKEKIHRKPLKYYLEVESGDVSKEEYKKVLNELEEMKKERSTEVEELIHLRRVNTCLRQELMSQYEEHHEQHREHEEGEFEGGLGIMHYDSEHELHYSLLEHHNDSAESDHASSKRKKFLKRLKRWVEGSEKVVKPEIIKQSSVSCGSKKPQVSSNSRFCSSA